MTVPPPIPAPFLYNAIVLDWHDGDTGRFTVDRGMRDYSTWSVRLVGCAARELSDPGGIEARDWLRQLLPPGSPVVLATVQPDKYGDRVDADVWFGIGYNLAARLIDKGWAAPWNGSGKQPKPMWPRV